ncbi:MAG: hypothetical protein R3B45_07975 [Bdellovibrionota bacterium]
MNQLVNFHLSFSIKMRKALQLLIVSTVLISNYNLYANENKQILEENSPKREAMKKKALGFTITNDYVHTWIRFPTAIGKSLSGGNVTVKPVTGIVTIFFFIASWDVKSQEILFKLKEIEKKYKNLDANFVYIFTHDTYEDATAFAKEYDIEDGIIASHEINKAFHNPKVPSIYIGDREGWLSTRFLDVKQQDLKELDYYLYLLTII